MTKEPETAYAVADRPDERLDAVVAENLNRPGGTGWSVGESPSGSPALAVGFSRPMLSSATR